MTAFIDTTPTPDSAPQWTAFAGTRLLARGTPLDVALAVQAALKGDPNTAR